MAGKLKPERPSAHQPDTVSVGTLLSPFHPHPLRLQRIDPFTRIIGPDGQVVIIPAVDEDQQFYAAGAAKGGHGIEGGPHHPARCQNVVDQNDPFVFNHEGDVGGIGAQGGVASSEIIAVERSVQITQRYAGRG